jgi:hypothetical protein
LKQVSDQNQREKIWDNIFYREKNEFGDFLFGEVIYLFDISSEVSLDCLLGYQTRTDEQIQPKSLEEKRNNC